MKASAVIKRPSEVSGAIGSPPSLNANVSRLGGASVTVDPALDPTSTNPVENKAITEAIAEINGNLTSLDAAIDDLAEGKQDKLTIDSVPKSGSANPVQSGGVFDAVSGLQTEISQKADAADIPTVPTNLSAFSNDVGYITGYTETDPTVPSWAKAASKPTYTAAEVGALPSSTTIPSKTSDLTNDSGFVNASGAAAASPVQSVNGQTGAVSLTIPTVPNNVSAFTNDAGYITLADLPIYSGGVQ